MFIVALFIVSKFWEQSRCPSTDENINKYWHIYKMEYYSAIKRNKLLFYTTTWINFKCIILVE